MFDVKHKIMNLDVFVAAAARGQFSLCYRVHLSDRKWAR